MRRSRAPSNWPGPFFAARSWAGCTTNMFGFDLRQAQPVSDSNISIRSTADWRKILADIVSEGHVGDGWLQMPIRKVRQADRYELPSTHEIEVRASQDDEKLRFLILILGFL